MIVHKALYPKHDIDRLYVSRKEKGRGLANIESSVDASIQGLEDYIKKRNERLIWPYYLMVFAQTRIHPREWDTQISLGFWDTNRSPNPGQKTRPSDNEQ